MSLLISFRKKKIIQFAISQLSYYPKWMELKRWKERIKKKTTTTSTWTLYVVSKSFLWILMFANIVIIKCISTYAMCYQHCTITFCTKYNLYLYQTLWLSTSETLFMSNSHEAQRSIIYVFRCVLMLCGSLFFPLFVRSFICWFVHSFILKCWQHHQIKCEAMSFHDLFDVIAMTCN